MLCYVSLQKYWSSTQSLNYYVHVSTLFFKVMRLSQNFSEIAWLVVLARKDPRKQAHFFLVLLISLKSQFCLAHYVVVPQKRNKHLFSSKHSVLNKHPP